MPSNQWILSFKYRFGIPIYKEERKCPCCALVLDKWGDHATSCTGSFSKGSAARIARHEAVRDVLLHELHAGKISARKDPLHVLDSWVAGRPADIYLPYFIGGKGVCVDITIVRSLPEASSTSIFIPQELLSIAANSKIDKYNDLCCQSGLLFRPFP
jgi:hypothetical protein